MGEKHSAVCYIFREGAFTPVRETKPLRNEFDRTFFSIRALSMKAKLACIFARPRMRNILRFLSRVTAG